MKEIVSVSAPGKLMLLGEHAVVYDRPCLVTAVDQRLRADLSVSDSSQLSIEAPDVSIKGYQKPITALGKGDIPKGAAFVEHAVLNFRNEYPFDAGLEVKTKSEFSASFGFGSSSASTVCVVKALSEIFEKDLSEKEIFELSYKTVLDVQGVGSGFDIAAGVYGGTLYFLTGGKKIEPLSAHDFNLVVGYSGQKADTAEIIKKIAKKRENGNGAINDIFVKIEELVEKGKLAVIASDWETLGKLMNENQELLAEIGVSTEKLDEMIAAANKAGAFGAKLSGAGGGDCMIALCANERIGDVQREIEKVGGEIINVKVDAEGVRVEK